MNDLATIEQASQVSAELANTYIIGGLTEAAQLPGGVELQDASVHLLANLGIEAAPAAAESGIALAASLAATRGALSSTATKAAQQMARNPRAWGVATATAIGAAGISAGAYMWMTEDQRVALEQIRQDAALKAKALQAVPEDARAGIAEILANRTVNLPRSSIMPFVIGGAVLGAIYLIMNRSK